MTWTRARLQGELKPLIGQRLSHRRVAADSLILYFYGQPGDKSVCSIWLEPPWRYERDGKLIVGSMDIGRLSRCESAEDKDKFREMCALLKPILEVDLVDIKVVDTTLDISLEFGGRQYLRVFSNSAFDDEQWVYRNVPENFALYISPTGIVEEKIDRD